MTKFKKALKSYNKTMKHAFLNIGFHKPLEGVNDYNALNIAKSDKIGKYQQEMKNGGVIARGRL